MNNWTRTILILSAFYTLISCKKKIHAKKIKNPQYSLELNRGAFHYDRFKLTNTKLYFYPSDIDRGHQKKYVTPLTVTIDTTVTLAFFRELETKGIWDLQEHYMEETTDTSLLQIIFTAGDRKTKIECDDYLRGCPQLIQYIEEKIIELEGNDLKRIYLPG